MCCHNLKNDSLVNTLTYLAVWFIFGVTFYCFMFPCIFVESKKWIDQRIDKDEWVVNVDMVHIYFYKIFRNLNKPNDVN